MQVNAEALCPGIVHKTSCYYCPETMTGAELTALDGSVTCKCGDGSECLVGKGFYDMDCDEQDDSSCDDI